METRKPSNLLEAARMRPGMYVGGTDSLALHHLVYFLMDGCFEEARLGEGRYVVLEAGEDGSVSLFGTGRVLPMEVLARVVAGDHAWRDPPAFASMSWASFLPVVYALSSSFRIDTWEQGIQWQLHGGGATAPAPAFRVEPMSPLPLEASRGMRITFTPDASIFPEARFDPERLFRRCRELAVLAPGTCVRFTHRPSGRDEILCYPQGIAQWVRELSDGYRRLHAEPLAFDVNWEGLRVRCALQWCEEGGEVISFANTVRTTRQGVHVDGVFLALQSALRKLTGSRGGFTRSRLAKGLTAVIAAEGEERRLLFQGPTKELLAIPGLDKAVRDLLRPRLLEALRDHPVLPVLSQRAGMGRK